MRVTVVVAMGTRVLQTGTMTARGHWSVARAALSAGAAPVSAPLALAHQQPVLDVHGAAVESTLWGDEDDRS